MCRKAAEVGKDNIKPGNRKGWSRKDIKREKIGFGKPQNIENANCVEKNARQKNTCG